MDDLIRIKGVGAATAKKLVEAGIASLAALAQLTPEHEHLAAIAQTPEQAQAWIAAASELAAAPPQDQSGTNTPPKSDRGGGDGNPAVPAGGPAAIISSEQPKAGSKDAKVKQAAAKPESDLTIDTPTIITVIGPSKGLRRAGRLFGSTPSTIMVTTDELKLIEADPGLSVTPGDVSKVEVVGGAPAARLTLADCLDDKGEPRAIRVLGPAKGRRRGGHSFGSAAVTLTPSKEQLEQIIGDAELSVALA